MKALIIYESIFGNTLEIAEAIADGLNEQFQVTAAEVNESHDDIESVDLLVLGGPTHAWSMSRNKTRDDARSQAENKGIQPVSKGTGIRELIDQLHQDQHRPVVTAFDTAVGKRWWLPTGSAAGSALKRLRNAGFECVADGQQFRVAGTEGPLVEGELERARQWGQAVAKSAMELIVQRKS